MPRLAPCPFCDGQGVVPFERGPAVEPCTTCKGAGRLYPDPELKGLFAALLHEADVFTKPEMRLLLLGLDALERRVAAMEDGRAPG